MGETMSDTAYSAKEISEILGTSVGALKASYHFAIKKVEDFVTED